MPHPALSNVEYLTHENKVWSAKKKHKKGQVKEVLFDENARRYASFCLFTTASTEVTAENF
jgi:hypothetical protein